MHFPYFCQMISFDNTENAFIYKSNSQLKKAAFLFKSIGNPWLTKIGIALIKFGLIIKLPIKGLIKNTMFQQFCGGETLTEASNVAEKIFAHGVGVILDYGVEGKKTEAEFDETANGFIEAIQFAAGKKHIPFISIKVTGFARFELLEKMDAHEKLSSCEVDEFNAVIKRMQKICEAAVKSNVMILIDAEETWVQDPVDELAMSMMENYNKAHPFIFNTYQIYRKDRLSFLDSTHKHALEKNIVLGAKIVRGAYMEKERARAEDLQYESPIQPSKEACDIDYDAAIKYCIDNLETIALFIGTHNEKSCYTATTLLQKKNISPKSTHIYFSQLFGMSDNISFNLAHAGYNVSKYLPYGPVQDVVPYLMRRAQENTSVAGQTGRELGLIKKELKRRSLIK
jgi:proline dehydrogenase